MAYTDEQLIELRKKLSGRENLNKTIRTLLLKKEEIEKRLKPLEEAKIKEHSDVEKLEKGGIKSFFYSITGQKVEKLNKEKDEAYEADKKYEVVYKEYSALCDNLNFYIAEIKKLDEYEKTLDCFINEKKLAMKKSGHPLTEEFEQEEKLLIKIVGQVQNAEQSVYRAREVKESISMLYNVIENLYFATRDDGCEWRTVDFLSAGSVTEGRCVSADFSEQLKELEGKVAALACADVNIKAELKELRVFADRLVLLFSATSVLAPVQNIYEKAKENRDRISSVEFMLIELYDEKRREYFDVKGKYTDLIIDAKL